jgi:anti-sigma regulatory factor (Ser/Thr protein kinase)
MNKTVSLRFPAELTQLAKMRHFVAEQAALLGADAEMVDAVVLATNELATNTIIHGYRGQPGAIDIELGQVEQSLVVQLRDLAPPFDPTYVPPPDITVPLHLRPAGGMGIYLTRRMTDALTHRITAEGGNEVTLVKHGIARSS